MFLCEDTAKKGIYCYNEYAVGRYAGKGCVLLMNNSYRFFENRACKYFPCHEGLKELNCLFCYCPLYARENCPGNPAYMEVAGKRIKVCSNCTFPHRPENYDAVMEILRE